MRLWIHPREQNPGRGRSVPCLARRHRPYLRSYLRTQGCCELPGAGEVGGCRRLSPPPVLPRRGFANRNPGERCTRFFATVGSRAGGGRKDHASLFLRSRRLWLERPGPEPRTSRQMAVELHTPLTKSGVNSPYVLVGHSFGGLNVRLFAELYPTEVGGMVLELRSSGRNCEVC